MTEPHDPLRSLDGTGPQGSWSDVVARAHRSVDLPLDLVAGGRSRRPLLVAAAVLAVLALAGAVTLAAVDGGKDHKTEVVAGPGDQLDPPAAIWGRTWQLSSVEVDGHEQPVVPSTDGAPVRLDATESTRVRVNLCGTLSGSAELSGDKLIVSDVSGRLNDCADAASNQTLVLISLLRQSPTISVTDDELTLRGAVAINVGSNQRAKAVGEAHFYDASTFDPPSAIWDRTWTATRFVDDGKNRSIERLGEPAGPVEFRFDSAARATPSNVPASPPSVSFRACNSVTIGLALKGERLVSVGGGLSTAMGCPPPSSEAFLYGLFRTGAVVEVRGDRAILRSGADRIELAGKDRAIGSPAIDPPSAMWGRQWRLSELTDDGMYEGGEYASIDARKEGRLLLSACDSWESEASLHGNELAVTKFRTTSVADCDRSPEHSIVTILPIMLSPAGDPPTKEMGIRRPTTVEVAGDRLTLRSNAAVAIFYDSASYSPAGALRDRRWVVDRVLAKPGGGDPDRSGWTDPAVLDATRPGYLTVAGCNGAGGAITIDDRGVVAPNGDWSHTRKACAQGLMDQDEWFGSFLAARPVARTRGDRLELVTEDGRRVEAHAEGGSEPSYEVTTTTSNPGQPSTTMAPATTVPDTTVPADQPPATTTSTSPPTTTPTTTSPPTTTTATVTFRPGGGSAEGFIGYEWHVVSVTGEGADPQYAGAVVDARTAGRVSVSGCNGAGGAMRLDSDRLVKDGDWAHTAMGCHPTSGGVDLEARDAWFEALLTDGPRVELTPDRLAATLRTGIAAVNLEHP